METSSKPIQHAIVPGLICAIVFVPANLGLNFILNRDIALNLSFFVCFTILAMSLPALTRKPLGPFAALLPIVGLSAFLTRTTAAYMMLLLTAFSLARGMYSLQTGWLRALASELLLCFGGALIVAALHPDGLISWALATWMFALIQGLYFIIFSDKTNMAKKHAAPDPFERAHRRAVEIIDS